MTLVVLVVVIGAPLLYAMLVSTQSNTEYFGHQLTPGSSLKENFIHVWENRNLGRFMLNSTIQAIIITVGKAITAILAGMAFVHFTFRGRWVIFWFVLVTLMMPTEISIIALAEIIGDFGWGDSMAAITVPFLASATGAF
ncbi:MAG: glycerol-3-phosphate ABC transporter permease, partial [Ilumatobacter coccineus]